MKIKVFFTLLLCNFIYSQSPCPEVLYTGTPTNIISSYNTTLNENLQRPSSPMATPDERQYIDNYPDKQYVYKLVFKIIRDNYGNRITGFVGEDQAMNAIRDLNLSFNPFNIFFKYGGFEYIDDSNLTGNRSIGTLYNDISNPHSTPNSFNIFVLDGDILSSDGLTPGFGPQTGTLTFVSYIGLTSKRILSHEVGHNFYLYHDFRNYGDATSCEHATRDFQNSFNTYDYNADWAGDRIHDTPATKIWNISEYTTECSTYQGGDIDCNQERPL